MKKLPPEERAVKSIRDLHQRSMTWCIGPNGLSEGSFFARWAKELNEFRERQRAWRSVYLARNRDKMNAYFRAYSKKWRAANPDKAKAQGCRGYKKRQSANVTAAREYRKKLKSDPVRLAAYRAYCRTKMAAKLHSDVQCRLRFRIRNRIWMALDRGIAKAGKTVDLLGCSIPFFKEHLESMWSPGMSWDNYGRGGWHIDHHRPCASFDLTDPAQQFSCFHYTNCRPMWEFDNLSKGTKVPLQVSLATSGELPPTDP